MQNKFDVIVVGAGAAGLLAAGRAAENGAKVLVLEKMERPGRKLLITGKGRCNITNNASQSEFLKHIQPNSRFLKSAFSAFFNQHIIELLGKFGVETIIERGERVFPVSNKSSDVVEALLKWNKKNGVEIYCRQKVQNILVENNQLSGIEVQNESRETVFIPTKALIVCTGGLSYPATGSDGDGLRWAKDFGIEIEKARPALVPVETEGNIANSLQGLSLKNVTASVWVNGKKALSEFGEMLFAHFGLTGPIILTLSRFIVDEFQKGNKVEVSIDLKPALDEQKLDQRLLRDLNEHGKKQLDNIFKLWLPSKLIPVFIELTGLDEKKECHQVNAKERKKVLQLMKDFRFKVNGFRPFKEAIITAGGIETKELDPNSMESKKIKGLFFAGEILNLDADTGGYNLQIAFSTGWLAGESAAKQIVFQHNC